MDGVADRSDDAVVDEHVDGHDEDEYGDWHGYEYGKRGDECV